jgi:hypothetical protein
MGEKIPARFRKTKTDKWAVMAPVEDLEKAMAEGGKIEVQRKSGDWGTFQVGSLGRPFEVDGVQMCYGYAPGDGEPGAEAPASSTGAGAATRQVARSAGAQPSAALSRSGGRSSRPTSPPPPRDEHEPLPEYRGGPDDEWHGDH